ncbi:MAG: hypothetical protein CVV13_10960 [Gammaproteobacteria bacterium HGW-Gammaproteobacteria-3]|nr:MAG: hypothetical protein CVV13_10960 [Gammaproteobacteria bacterium HGW-Gammaproteobacteria-3]
MHFPTDLNLFHDAIRKLIQGCGQWNDTYPLLGWRHMLSTFDSSSDFTGPYKHSSTQPPKTRSIKRPGKSKSIRPIRIASALRKP